MPVPTLARDVPNFIVAVDEAKIVRRSAASRGGGDGAGEVPRHNIAQDPAAAGRGGSNCPRSAAELRLRPGRPFISGVRFDREPTFRLVLEDRHTADQPWSAERRSAEAKERLFAAIRELRQYRGDGGVLETRPNA